VAGYQTACTRRLLPCGKPVFLISKKKTIFFLNFFLEFFIEFQRLLKKVFYWQRKLQLYGPPYMYGKLLENQSVDINSLSPLKNCLAFLRERAALVSNFALLCYFHSNSSIVRYILRTHVRASAHL
jgi:hypothetical protein